MPGTSWISCRTSIYFHPMSGGQVKNSMLVYFSLTRTSYLVTGQVKNLMYLPGGQVKFFKDFLPLLNDTLIFIFMHISFTIFNFAWYFFLVKTIESSAGFRYNKQVRSDYTSLLYFVFYFLYVDILFSNILMLSMLFLMLTHKCYASIYIHVTFLTSFQTVLLYNCVFVKMFKNFPFVKWYQAGTM